MRVEVYEFWALAADGPPFAAELELALAAVGLRYSLVVSDSVLGLR